MSIMTGETSDGSEGAAPLLARLLTALCELIEAKLYEAREEFENDLLHAEEWEQHCDQYWEVAAEANYPYDWSIEFR